MAQPEVNYRNLVVGRLYRIVLRDTGEILDTAAPLTQIIRENFRVSLQFGDFTYDNVHTNRFQFFQVYPPVVVPTPAPASAPSAGKRRKSIKTRKGKSRKTRKGKSRKQF